MQVVEGGLDVQALAKEILEPFLGWLQQIKKTTAEFRRILTEASTLEEQTKILGLTLEHLSEGVNLIPSLPTYAAILGITPEEVYQGFEVNRYIAPQWFIEQVEEAVRDQLATDFGGD